ncbi:MAG: hypothetical protein AAF430_24585 [Myxococcota bacterium]
MSEHFLPRRPSAVAPRLFALVALGAWLGCAAEAEAPEPELLVSEDRFRVLLASDSPSAADQAGELRVTVETTGGWHVAEEAPARLDLTAPATMAFEPAELRQSEVRAKHENGFEFVTKLFAEAPGGGVAQGLLKFGICEDDESQCVIVRRDLTLPIDVAFEN